ncbi:hypothetical protein [Streptomyces sp. NPDC004728]|uniref:hypothetical protein n=1 Tax=Streptomyces sp. NPDC004728 TaxID=3154289 RepID=UPI0033A81A5B
MARTACLGATTAPRHGRDGPRAAVPTAIWKVVALAGGQPQALTAVGAEHVLAATQSGVYESKDGGRTFSKRLDVEASGRH